IARRRAGHSRHACPQDCWRHSKHHVRPSREGSVGRSCEAPGGTLYASLYSYKHNETCQRQLGKLAIMPLLRQRLFEPMSHAAALPSDVRPGEVLTTLPQHTDASVYFIGRIRTPWQSRKDCPKRGDMENGPICRIEVAIPWREALADIEKHT